MFAFDNYQKYLCVITKKIMMEPVFTADGQTYEREAIEEWFKEHDTSPKTGLPLANKQLTPNLDKKTDIMEFLEQHPELYDTEEIYLPKTTIKQLSEAISNNQQEIVKSLFTKDRRLLLCDLVIKEPIINDYESVSIETKTTTFYFASQYGSPELLDIILECLHRTNTLHKQFEIPRPINFSLVHLNVLLQKTVEQNNNEKFLLLLKLGANIEQPSLPSGNTLLHRMVVRQDIAAIKLLIANGALLESHNIEDSTPLFLSVCLGNTTLTKLLLEKGADPKISCGAKQLTPLHVASKNGNKDIIQLLLNAKVQIDSLDIDGNTPLHLAANFKKEEAILLLLEAGAYYKSRNYQDQTPADIARSNKAPKVAILIEAKARQIKQSKQEKMWQLVAEQSLQIERLEKDFRELRFSSLPKFIFKVSSSDLIKFLKHVGLGEQDEAESMLKINRDFALVPGAFTDCAGKEFKQATAFQYAIWALDYHMWNMLLKYMPTEAVIEQLTKVNNEGIEAIISGASIYEKTRYISWQNLIDALQNYIDNWHLWSEDERKTNWYQRVGEAQLTLPAHVINEYSRTDRSFSPCPTFNETHLPRIGRDLWKTIKVKGDWTGRNYCLGQSFAWSRGSRKEIWALDCKTLESYIQEHAKNKKVGDTMVCWQQNNIDDSIALTALFNIRVKQREQLTYSLTHTTRNTLGL
ncbi:MAG: ankyrin repeat domain-containing protein [Candidatus Falkowbacteria bacterium]